MTRTFSNTQTALASVESLARGQTISVDGRFATVVYVDGTKTIRFVKQQSYAQTQVRDGRKFHTTRYGRSYEEM